MSGLFPPPLSDKKTELSIGNNSAGSSSSSQNFIASWRRSVSRSMGMDNSSSQDVPLFSSKFDFRNIEPLHGKIVVQFIIHLVWSMVLVLTAFFFGWAKEIRPWITLPYLAVAYFIFQISRLCYARRIESILPLYLSYIPMTILIVWSREAHMITGIISFISLISIHLQLRPSNMRLHLFIASIVFAVVYCGSVAFINFFYVDTTYSDRFRGRWLSKDRTILWGREVTVIISMLLIGIAFYKLERFIMLYANSMIEHDKNVHSLVMANRKLKFELTSFKGGIGRPDLESPVTKVMNVLSNIKKSKGIPSEILENIESVIKALSSNEIFVPTIVVDGDVDVDVNTWIKSSLVSGSMRGYQSLVSSKSFTNIDEAAEHQKSNSLRELADIPSIDLSITPIIEDSLKSIFEWDFDVFKLAVVTNGRPLFFLSRAIFAQLNFLETFSIKSEVLDQWLIQVEAGYRESNMYHNSIHAADVCVTTFYFIIQNKLRMNLSMQDIFAIIVAAIIHDYDHPGVNNSFLINTRDELALRYNDRSVLENYHCSASFSLMKQNLSLNILAGMTPILQKEVRSMILSCVLATDMAQHFDIVGKINNKISVDNITFDDVNDRTLILQVAIKAADTSNPTKSLPIYVQWVNLVMEEFYRQGDRELMLHLPISSFMDRRNPNIPKCQVGFIDFIVRPLFDIWMKFLNETHDDNRPLQHLELNHIHWKGQIEDNQFL